jgi:hypothetical protein
LIRLFLFAISSSFFQNFWRTTIGALLSVSTMNIIISDYYANKNRRCRF